MSRQWDQRAVSQEGTKEQRNKGTKEQWNNEKKTQPCGLFFFDMIRERREKEREKKS